MRIRNPNDVDAWNDFVSLYSSIVRGYCQQRRLQANDIDDIAQEVMLKIANGIRNFEYNPARGRFRAWLGTITVNQINTHLTKRTKQNLSESVAGNDASAGCPYADPDAEWVLVFSEQVFRVARQRVRPEFADVTWACFEATWIRNEDPVAVAEELRIRLHAVYVNKSRVLNRLEKEVQVLAEDLPFANGKTTEAG